MIISRLFSGFAPWFLKPAGLWDCFFFFFGVALVLSRKFASGPGIFMIFFCHDFSLEGLDWVEVVRFAVAGSRWSRWPVMFSRMPRNNVTVQGNMSRIPNMKRFADFFCNQWIETFFKQNKDHFFQQTALAMIGALEVCARFGNSIIFGLPNHHLLHHAKTPQLNVFLEPSWLHTCSRPRRGRSAKLGTLRCETHVSICFC